jgi:uncharacterized delta-60 repeat protein
MALSSWLRNVKSLIQRPNRKRNGYPRPAKRSRSHRPLLELLEDRTLLNAGALDLTFGTGGKVLTDFPIAAHDFGLGLAIQADGKVVVVGQSSNADFVGKFAVARYNPNGTLDTTFGSGGIITTEFGPGGSDASSVALQSDGKIVVAGGANGDFALARYNSNGTLDAGFGAGGKGRYRLRLRIGLRRQRGRAG